MACSVIQVWRHLRSWAWLPLPPADSGSRLAAGQFQPREPLIQTGCSGSCHRPPSSAFASSGAPGQSDHPGELPWMIFTLASPRSFSIELGDPADCCSGQPTASFG